MKHPVTPEISNLDKVVVDQWASLVLAAKDRHHPWHTQTLANVGEGIAQIRTVVLRSADAESRVLSCHTDSRSPKITQLETDPHFSWHFYDRDAKVQLRAYGRAWVQQNNDLTHERWLAGAWRSAQCYRTPVAPGDDCQVEDLDIDQPIDPATGEEHFAVLACEINEIDWLFLRVEGNRRARFIWSGDVWHGQWIAP